MSLRSTTSGIVPVFSFLLFAFCFLLLASFSASLRCGDDGIDGLFMITRHIQNERSTGSYKLSLSALLRDDYEKVLYSFGSPLKRLQKHQRKKRSLRDGYFIFELQDIGSYSWLYGEA